VNLLQYERQVRQHQHRVYGLAVYLLGDREEAEDVTQEVWLRLWHHRHEVDEAHLPGWLLRVTRNACIDALRRRKVYRALVRTDSDGVHRTADPGRAPDDETASTLFREHLERALRQLKEPHRSIVILRELHDMKYEEISEALGLPLNTVKVYLHRARKTLRKLMSEVSERATV
jgi:RNA polymerase sigma-70 factor (ECF subfamily)